MRMIYREAEQGHRVPTRAYAPGDPLPTPRMTIRDIEYDPDRTFPAGATVQNSMLGPDAGLGWYVCNECDEEVREDRLDIHECSPSFPLESEEEGDF